jgi:chromosome segregation ATPase
MHEHKRKFHFLSTQVKQSKSEIEDKNQFIVFEHFNLQNVKDDIDQLEGQNTTTFNSLEKADAVIKTQSKQIRKLSTIIADADEELRVQIKQYNLIVNEQRVLNQQPVKRNDELATLYEQLKLQNSILTKSASHYKEKQILLQEFELEYQLVNKTLEEVLGDIKKYVELKDTIAEIEEQLVQEQLKVKALSDELKKPINIHRSVTRKCACMQCVLVLFSTCTFQRCSPAFDSCVLLPFSSAGVV